MDLETVLRREEGTIPYAYQDSEGYWSIGVGFLIDRRLNGGLLPVEIAFILNNRIELAKTDVQKRLPWLKDSVDEVRYSAIVLMAYQLGINRLMQFQRMLAAVRAHDWAAAKTEALNSAWARQTPARAARVAEQLVTGVWQ